MWYMNEERELLVKAFKEFAEKEIRPIVDRMEKEEMFPTEALRKVGQLGFTGLGVDERAYGGEGPDYISVGLMQEEFAKVSHVFALLAGQTAMGVNLFNTVFTPEQIETIAKPALKGDLILTIPVTEPCGIFNPVEYETTAVLDGDEWVINGSKVLITGIDEADLHLVVCKTSEKFDPITMRGISVIAVPKGTPGFEIGHLENKLGWKGSHTGQMYFNDCRVPKENLLGELDNVWLPIMIGRYGQEILEYAPMNLGAMEACYEKTLHFLKNRIQNGKSLWDTYEVARNDMTKLWAKIDIFRNATYAALEEKNRGEDVYAKAVALKVEGEKLLREVASECIELHGGTGTVYETGIERFYRDGKMVGVGCGSNKTLLNMVASLL